MLGGMEQLNFSIRINAEVQKVWHAMLDDKPYREWTAVFHPGSHYLGTWTKGSKIQFLSPNENGKESGLTSLVADIKQYEYVTVHHQGVIQDGAEDMTSPAARKWQGLETYTFRAVDGQTEVSVAVEVPEEMREYMEKIWPTALAKVKENAEKLNLVANV